MPTKPEYLKKLSELRETFVPSELAGFLGVTERSIQNYLNKEQPAVPYDKTIKKIHEVFQNWKEGKELKPKNPDQEDQGYKDKYIRLLENQVKELEIRRELIQEVQDRLGELTESLKVVAAFQKAFRDYWAETCPPEGKTPEQAKKVVHNKAVANLAEFSKRGIVV